MCKFKVLAIADSTIYTKEESGLHIDNPLPLNLLVIV